MIENRILEYFKQDALAAQVFLGKYSFKGNETPEDMHIRLAENFAKKESSYINSYMYKKEDFEKLSRYGKERSKNLVNNHSNIFKYLFDVYYHLFKNFDLVIPAGSVMQGLGTENPVSLSNCFFNGAMEDNMEDIYMKALSMAQIGKRRGGTSTDISYLRPRGAFVNNSANRSSGPIPFLDLIDVTGKIIGQEGRKMAMMVTMDINHPDIAEFATIKNDLTKVTNANLSIKLNKSFMEAVEKDEDYILKFPCDLDLSKFSKEYLDVNYNELYQIEDHTNDNEVCYIKKIKAKELWDVIINSAWKYAEPGLLFWDNVLDYDPTSVYEELKPLGTNPCSELPLGILDSCRLLATNLYSLVKNPFLTSSYFDKEFAYKIFYEAQILADILVDLEIDAVDMILSKINPNYKGEGKIPKEGNITEEFKLWIKIREIGRLGRRTGTGITAYADMLAALNLPYGEKEFTDSLFKLKLKAELDASTDMSIIKGSFPLYIDESLEYEFDIKKDRYVGKNKWYEFITLTYPLQAANMRIHARRNAGISTVAPTGSTSLMTLTSSGIEPVFKPIHKRRKTVKDGEDFDLIDNGNKYKEFIVVHPKLKDWYSITGYQILEEFLGEGIDKVPDVNEVSIKDWEYLYERSPYFNQSSDDIDYKVRVDTQALIQKYITSSISSTVNLPKDTKKEVVADVYKRADASGCKGITVYVDESRSGVLVSLDNTKKEEFPQHNAPVRPKELKANLHLATVNKVSYAIVVGLYNNKPYEVFVFNTLGVKYKKGEGKIVKIKKEHYKYISEDLVIENLNDSGNSSLEKATALYTSMLLRQGASLYHVIKTSKKIDPSLNSFVSVMGRILSKYDQETIIDKCPKCGGELVKEAGCERCLDCGESKCS